MSNKGKHTQGPWRVAKVVDSAFPKPHIVYVLIDDGRKRNVCAVSVYGRDENGKPTKTRQELGEKRAAPSIGDDECQANARLIAAAPDLLEALEELGDWLAYGLAKPANAKPTAEDLKRCQEVAAKARAAISKAKGE